MKTVDFPNLGKALTHDTWQEQLAHSLCIMIDDMSLESMQVTTPEESDFQAVETDLQAFAAYTKSWYESNVDSSEEGGLITTFDKNYLPDVALFLALLATGQWGGVFSLFVKVGLEFMLDFTEKKLDPETSTGDVAEAIEKALMDTNAEGEQFSLLWALARQQLRIMIQKGGDFDDAIFEDVDTSS